MIELEVLDNKIFKDAFDSISKIVDEVVCEVDSDGFHMTAMDRSHICFVGLNFKKDLFDRFICEAPKKICLDTEEFTKILKRAKKNDILVLGVDDDNLTIKFKGDVDRKFNIRLIDMDYESPSAPLLEFPTYISVPSKIVSDALVDMELFSDKLYFLINEEYFIVDTDGEFGDAKFEFLHGEKVEGEAVKSGFSIPKLKDIFKASSFSDTVEVGLGNDMPVNFKFELITGDGELNYLLAPRIDAEEE